MNKQATLGLLFIGFIFGVLATSAVALFVASQWPAVNPSVEPSATPSLTPTATQKPTPTPVPTPTPPVQLKTITWAGHTWQVTDDHGGVFTANNVWVDEYGMLHMMLIYDNGTWKSFNLKQLDKVGYGTFKWTVVNNVDYIQDVQDGGNPFFVFAPFLFDNTLTGDWNNAEIDVEMCKWGNSTLASNTDWTIHPDNHQVQYKHFNGSGNTYTLEWMPDYIKFTVQGPEQPYDEYIYNDTSKIPPVTGQMQMIIYIGQYKNKQPPGNLKHYEAEVILNGYKIIPYD